MVKGFLIAFDANYAVGGLAVLKAMRKFHPDVKPYVIAPARDVAPVQDLMHGLAEVMPPPRQLRHVPEGKQICVSRVFIATLPVDVALYLDVDVCICRPMPEWWDVPAGQVNAVRDTSTCVLDNVPTDLKATYLKLFPEVAVVKGFNSGVFALEPRRWADLAERFEAVLDQAQFEFYHSILDQPILNGLFHSHVNWLPGVFNAHDPFTRPIPGDARLVHFTCPTKPWMPGFPHHEPSYYYWHRYGAMNEAPLELLRLRVNSKLQMPGRAAIRKLRALAGTPKG